MSRRPAGEDPVVRKAGMTYQLVADDIGTTLTLSRVRRRSDSLLGYMVVKTTALDVKTIGNTGILLVGSMNMLGPKVRQDFAKRLSQKTPGFDVDWENLLDHMAEQVLAMELVGEPIVEIGDVPVPKRAGTWAWEPFVPKGVPALFYGPGGSGKSRFALAGAVGIEMGREILPNCPPAMKGRVLYLDWETDQDTVAERIQHICAGVGQPPIRMSYRRCIRPLADDIEDLAAYIAEKEIVFLVVDSAAAAIGKQGEYGDANEGALRLFEAIRVLSLPTLLVDHVSKQEMRMSGKTRGALPYGSIYKVNMARAAWEVRPATTPDEESQISSFHHTKANDSGLRPPFTLKANFDESSVKFEIYEGPVLEDDEWTTPMKKGPVAERIEGVLRGAKMAAPDIAKYLGEPANTVLAALNRTKGPGGKKFIKDDESGLWAVATTKLTIMPGGQEGGPIQ